MSAGQVNVHHIARLARLELTPEEEQKFGEQIAHILKHIEKLNELDVTNVEPTAHAVPLANVTRPDEVQPSLPHEDALRNSPAQTNGLFRVPVIVE